MSNTYDRLKDEINECFYHIVGIINEIIEHRSESFSQMLDVGEKIQRESDVFVGETDVLVRRISADINSKIENLNMEKMRGELNDATKTFLSITEELELLSYNTICRTMALGDKGATITHISKEIKKYSTTVKALLDEITKDFSAVYEEFKYIADNIINSDMSTSTETLRLDDTDNIVISSDVSVLIENSQFHDIFSQELEIINNAIGHTRYSDPYEAGKIFGIYEKAGAKLEYVKNELQSRLYTIKDVMKDFLYTFNTDLQNIVSKTNILREELISVHNVSKTICMTISDLQKKTANSQKSINNAASKLTLLGKQSKTFKNLVVVTAIEVARINDEDLRSVVASMLSTEQELHKLISQLEDNIDKWQALQKDFSFTFKDAGMHLKSVCDPSLSGERDDMLQSTYELEKQLTEFRKIFTGEKYLRYFDRNTEILISLFGEFNLTVNDEFEVFSSRLTPAILSDEEFTRGRAESELKDILASEDDQSSIEFF
ncbi:hypothetical protein [Seleniivibrio woodruffii]|uniref:Methyl-accepting chemotaxis protein n=1 Tax=Seleniivibrio woodruffii TaxID=1078050 RepID=A0A4V2PS96_9BACT|nr:hypothetical protein [Seleniivibrio woodruffii]TCK61861.1 hypothetical protein C8D98_0367 [Seleniivibrio woodruffii]TVZ35024.1 hypothetical protein OF66_0626 [Seleniivibrio woodruffii]